jgi:hypothetical protein
MLWEGLTWAKMLQQLPYQSISQMSQQPRHLPAKSSFPGAWFFCQSLLYPEKVLSSDGHGEGLKCTRKVSGSTHGELASMEGVYGKQRNGVRMSRSELIKGKLTFGENCGLLQSHFSHYKG